MTENIYLTSAIPAILTFMELRHACLTSLKYFVILYMFVEWVILLHHCYFLFARPVWRFIFARRTATCGAGRAHERDEFCRVGSGGRKCLGVDVKVVMERLGMCLDCDDVIVSEEIVDLFEEEEPSLNEVKEAFGVFDRNKDGYIDATELQRALSEMGYVRISESECRRMIDGYDVDKDSKISFMEFLKLMEDCFQ